MVRTSGYLFDFPREYLKPALVVSLLSVWVLVGLFFYLNAFTRRRYFTIWSAAWLFYSLWLTLSLSLQDAGPSAFLLMVNQWCVGIAAVFMIWGAAVFLKQGTPERVFGLFLAFLFLWSYLGAYQCPNVRWPEFAVFATLGLGSGLTAYGFLQFRRESSYMGATLLALGFLLWGAYLACFPSWQASDQLIASGFLISAVLQLFIAVSMIVLVLEEVRATNQLTLLQIERQKSEAEGLRTKVLSSEERFRSLFTQASEAIVITAADNLRILELNVAARRLLSLAAEDTKPHFLSSFLRLQGANDAAPQTGVEWFAALTEQQRVEVVWANGTVIPAEVAGAPVVVDGVTAYQFFFREVTERRQLEQQLRQAEKLSALGQMISGIAHELNNPLAVIKGYLDLVLLRHDLGKQTRADLEKVAHESNRAARLVSNFLSFARERPAQREMIDINEVVRRVLELREMDLRLLGVQLHIDLDQSLPQTEADAAQIEQVIVNLLTNALHALAEWPNSRKLRITTGLRDDLIILRVQDSGPGVPSDVLPHIFEPFFTTKPVGTGTGLGLSIAHSIITDHQGRITCETSKEGGASFLIELPVLQASHARPSADDGASAPALTLSHAAVQARILVVDDEQPLAELLAELLSTLGHSTSICCSPIQALDLLDEQPFDLILSDFRMPLMNGREFYERLVARKSELANRVIFVTGDVMGNETRAFLQATATPHLSKPFRLDAVEAVVSSVLLKKSAVLAAPAVAT
ncbi:MAG: ATP-binding protein [Verrucomicrobiota bacterium]